MRAPDEIAINNPAVPTIPAPPPEGVAAKITATGERLRNERSTSPKIFRPIKAMARSSLVFV